MIIPSLNIITKFISICEYSFGVKKLKQILWLNYFVCNMSSYKTVQTTRLYYEWDSLLLQKLMRGPHAPVQRERFLMWFLVFSCNREVSHLTVLVTSVKSARCGRGSVHCAMSSGSHWALISGVPVSPASMRCPSKCSLMFSNLSRKPLWTTPISMFYILTVKEWIYSNSPQQITCFYSAISLHTLIMSTTYYSV